MRLDTAITRYLIEPAVRNWLLTNGPVRTVDVASLRHSCCYSIGFDDQGAAGRRDIQDVLIVCGTPSHFVLGVIAGLAQPHVFSKTPLMRNAVPTTRRFAIDLSQTECCEFMEFVHFDNGMTIIFLRHFRHTTDYTLPVVGIAVLYDSNGNELMRADTQELADCPGCFRMAKYCDCLGRGPGTSKPLSLSAGNWTDYVRTFLSKGRRGVTDCTLMSCLPSQERVVIFRNSLRTYTDVTFGNSNVMQSIQRKALHVLQLDTKTPRGDQLLMTPKLNIPGEESEMHVTVPSPAILGPGERKALSSVHVISPNALDVEAIVEIIDSPPESSSDGSRQTAGASEHPRPPGKKKKAMCLTCGKCFSHTGHLNRHIKSVHLGERSYKCDECGMAFFQASHLQSHITLVHHGVKAWECDLCFQRLSSECRLRTHLINVHRATPRFSCTVPGCTEQFVLTSDLTRHIRRAHPTVTQP